MQFKCTVFINASMEKVMRLFDTFEHLDKWQDGYLAHEHMDGEVGQVGARTKMFYKIGTNEIELIETIIEKDLPRIFKGDYQMLNTLSNTMSSHFSEVKPGMIQYDSYTEYYKFEKWSLKLMSYIAPFMFKRNSFKWMKQFKRFVESSPDIHEEEE